MKREMEVMMGEEMEREIEGVMERVMEGVEWGFRAALRRRRASRRPRINTTQSDTH